MARIGWGVAEARIHFGPFTYDPEQRALFRGDELVGLGPKSIDLLHVLLEDRGRVVEKADLMRRETGTGVCDLTGNRTPLP